MQCTGVGTLSLVLRAENPITPEMFGAVGDGVTDDYGACNAAEVYLRAVNNKNAIIGSKLTLGQARK